MWKKAWSSRNTLYRSETKKQKYPTCKSLSEDSGHPVKLTGWAAWIRGTCNSGGAAQLQLLKSCNQCMSLIAEWWVKLPVNIALLILLTHWVCGSCWPWLKRPRQWWDRARQRRSCSPLDFQPPAVIVSKRRRGKAGCCRKKNLCQLSWAMKPSWKVSFDRGEQMKRKAACGKLTEKKQQWHNWVRGNGNVWGDNGGMRMKWRASEQRGRGRWTREEMKLRLSSAVFETLQLPRYFVFVFCPCDSQPERKPA